jgi:multiple sugar transport system substrate-binding protein
MINRRHFLTTVAVGTASAAALAACGTGSSTSAGETGSAENPVTINYTWWGNDDRAERTRKAIALFESKNPDIKVNGNFTDFAGYWQKRATEAAGGGLPDVMQWDLSYLRDYGQRNQLLDLGTVNINTDAFDKSLLPSGQIRGKTYGIPTSTNAFAVYYDPAKLASLGIAEPTGKWSYKEFNDFLTEVGTKSNSAIFGSTYYTGVWWMFNIWLRQNNIEAFTEDGKLGFTKESLVEYWTMWEKLRTAGTTMGADAQADEPEGAEQGFIAQGKLLTDSIPGNALTPASGTLATKGGGQKLTTLPMPSGPSGGGNAMFTSGFAIPTNCDNVPTAAAFIDFFTNDVEAGKVFKSDNGAATNQKVLQAQLDDPELPALKKHELELYQQIVAKKPPTILYPPGYQATFESTFTRSYEEIAFGKKTVQQAADSFFTEANAGLGG